MLSTTNMSCTYTIFSLIKILYSLQCPLPTSVLIVFYFRKCKQIHMFFFASLVISGSVGRKEEKMHTRLTYSFYYVEFFSAQYLNPLLPILAWNLEYQILNFYGAPRARDWLVAM